MSESPIRSPKFPPATQRPLHRLLARNTEGTLTPAEAQELAALVQAYGRGLVAHARRLAATRRRKV